MKRRPITITLLILGLVAAGGGAWVWYLRQPRHDTVMRGWLLAQRHGCFSCHGPEGRRGASNPGSDEVKVPSWDGGMLMMYVEDASEISDWILHGSTGRRRDTEAHDHSAPTGSGHRGLVSMPAYKTVLTQPQVDDLVALVRTVGRYRLAQPPDLARQGREIAQNLGCFGCHQLEGLVGTPNPGSFKGYIPPWRGPDFEELVRDQEELRQWILDGKIDRFESDFLARYFTSRQRVQMPAYRDHVSDSDLAALEAYVLWVSRTETLFE